MRRARRGSYGGVCPLAEDDERSHSEMSGAIVNSISGTPGGSSPPEGVIPESSCPLERLLNDPDFVMINFVTA